MREFLGLLGGTVIYRPYVYAFFCVYLVFSVRERGVGKTLMFTLLAYIIAFLSELSATRNGFPFGRYVYIDTTRTRELWLFNIPFWDSLSFVFLAYFSGVLSEAISLRWFAIRSGLLMMLLDVVIDPLTLQGDRWFLGKIYYYPEPGFYFGVTAANFMGWLFVGAITQWMARRFGLAGKPDALIAWGAFVVYSAVFIFNLAVTWMIRDYLLFCTSLGVMLATLVYVGFGVCRRYPLFSRKTILCDY